MDNNIQTSANASQVHRLTYEETREILTPFAFELDKTLFGTPLAAPWRRAAALLVDLLCVAILSGAPGELLAIVIAVTAYKFGSKQKTVESHKVKGRKRRAFLRITGVFILFVTLLSVLPPLFDGFSENKQSGSTVSNGKGDVTESLNLKNTLMLTAMITDLITTIESSHCKNVSCWQDELTDEVEDFALFSFDNSIIIDALDDIVAATKLPKVEQMELHRLLFVSYQAQKAADNANNATVKLNELSITKLPIPDLPETKLPTFLGESVNNADDTISQEKAESAHQYSIVKLIEGIIEDLGLGFGWAAFYFSVLTVVWHGQTLGKKIFKIKVLQLDGTELSLWDSFGRYGGYGAGIATGMLGFLQVFWDPNRQAIHDKISATVVVNVYSPTTDLNNNADVNYEIKHEEEFNNEKNT